MAAIRVYTQSGGWQDIALVGPAGPPGPQGPPGATGGQGLPVGGAAGQILNKKSAADYDTQWSTFAPTYSAAATYKQGDYVKYNGSLWQANGDITPGTGYPGEPSPVLIASGVSTPPTRFLSTSQLGTWIDVTVDSSDPITSLRSGPMEIFGIKFATPGTMSFTSRPTGPVWDAFAYLLKEAGTSDATIVATADDEAGSSHPAFTSPVAVSAGNYYLTFSGYSSSEPLPSSSQIQITLGGGATLGAMPSGPGWTRIVAGVPAGGVGGQVLTKKSVADFDTQWVAGSAGAGIVAVKAAYIGNQNLTSVFSSDNVLMNDGDRCLLKDQTNPVENGIYIWSANKLTRAADVLSPGLHVYVQNGTVNVNTVWTLNVISTPTVGTDPLYFTRTSPPYDAQLRPSGIGTGQDAFETLPRWACNFYVPGSTGVIRLTQLTLRAGQYYEAAELWTGSVAGAGLTHSWAALVRCSNRAVLAVSADNVTAAWAAGGLRTFQLLYRALRDESCWLALMVAGTTQPNFPGAQMAPVGDFPNTGGDMLCGDAGSGQTVPPAVGATIAFPAGTRTPIFARLTGTVP